jgi:fructokinase
VDVVGALQATLGVEIAIDTDVGAAALGEYTWGAAIGTNSLLYLTVGTGIGGALLLGGKTLRGLQHSEMGHIRLPQDPERDPFPGWCPYHGNCFEGLASGPAIESRLGRRGEDLSDGDPFWDLEAEYIASALATYILILSPQRIVLGGGIMQREFLLSRIQRQVLNVLGDYVAHPAVLEHIAEYIVPPGLGFQSGILGGMALAALDGPKT